MISTLSSISSKYSKSRYSLSVCALKYPILKLHISTCGHFALNLFTSVNVPVARLNPTASIFSAKLSLHNLVLPLYCIRSFRSLRSNSIIYLASFIRDGSNLPALTPPTSSSVVNMIRTLPSIRLNNSMFAMMPALSSNPIPAFRPIIYRPSTDNTGSLVPFNTLSICATSIGLPLFSLLNATNTFPCAS